MRCAIRIAACWCVWHALAFAPRAHAGVVLANTRVVFSGDARDVTVRLSNRHAYPVLVEAWVDSPIEGAHVPFAADPPLFRIDPGKGQALRVHRLPGVLPEDRETLFWLNVLDVPPDPPATAEGSDMKIALQTRVKLFHRPKGLPGAPAEAPAALHWRVLDDARIAVDNPTPYHVTIARIAGHDGWDVQGVMVAPFAGVVVPYSKARGGSGRIVFEAINDLGGRDKFDSPLAEARAQ
ncbi:Chaperone protein EcpD [Lysobacter dokdonensis DS-58]|uniref:Chaperone protein EcpD n=1 Tax=Lysobacter dokdonensis DS-58 TaxID=1300345 RepID=A0A0A2X684_9GAMM|nr:Chaperone protein EcpD [Lysobacter dokdonensis DS-58]